MGISSALGSSALLPAGLGFRNLVVNGAMTVDQRNSGTAVTGQTSNFYAVDRFICSPNSNGIFTGQQTTNSSLSGSQLNEFKNSLGCTVTTARTAISTDVYGIRHRIEGNSCYQLAWGTSSAKPVVLSFWVRSSITGTYSVAFFNAAANRSYVATYTVNSANTWEYKTVSITGDLTGTWAKDNTTGIEIYWDFGCGSNYETTAGSWQAGIYVRTAASVKWISNSAATFYLTGVQLEQNYQPTPFEQRPYGVELQLCQRYYWRISGATAANVGLANGFGTGAASPSARRMVIPLPVPMRAKPTPVIAGTHWMYNASLTNRGITSLGFNSSSPDRISVDVNSTGATTTGEGLFWVIDSSSANDYLEASGAEL